MSYEQPADGRYVFRVRKSCDGTQNPRFGSEPAERIQHIIGDVGLLNHVVMKVSLIL